MKRAIIVFITLTALGWIPFALSMDLSGDVRMTGRGSKKVKLDETIVYFLPKDIEGFEGLEHPGTYEIKMIKKQFSPRVIAVPTGSQIKLPNQDNIAHNAFSPSKPNDFDLGFYGKNEEKEFVVASPGIIRVFCNVHFNMVAYILALDTPYYTQADANGEFQLNDLPQVPGTLVIWHDRSKEKRINISPKARDDFQIKMKVSKRRIPKHNNKLGGSYRKDRKAYSK